MSPQEEIARKTTPYLDTIKDNTLASWALGQLGHVFIMNREILKFLFVLLRLCVCLTPTPRIFFFLKTGSHNASNSTVS